MRCSKRFHFEKFEEKKTFIRARARARAFKNIIYIFCSSVARSLARYLRDLLFTRKNIFLLLCHGASVAPTTSIIIIAGGNISSFLAALAASRLHTHWLRFQDGCWRAQGHLKLKQVLITSTLGSTMYLYITILLRCCTQHTFSTYTLL